MRTKRRKLSDAESQFHMTFLQDKRVSELSRSSYGILGVETFDQNEKCNLKAKTKYTKSTGAKTRRVYFKIL